ncbi:MAG: permease-like cell division protein FtsX [Oscillospiraceae bacterium]
MKFSNFKYLVKQGLSNFRENRLMSVASVGVVCSCLIIVGVCGLLAVNVNKVADYLGDQNVVGVFLSDGISEEDKTALENYIKSEQNIQKYEYISKDDALKEDMETLGESKELLEAYQGEQNPYPASFRCTLEDLTKLSTTVEELNQFDGIDIIVSPTELAGVLVTIKSITYYGGIAILSILIFVSIVVISNTIRLTVFARRKEINIMKFVGATNSFIRLPFVVEGLVIGTISAMITFGFLSAGYAYAMYYLQQTATGWIGTVVMSFMPYNEIWMYMLPSFLCFGWFIGGTGSAISMKQYLRV